MSLDSTAPPSPTAPAGRDDLACPLCEYSLRGLVDPRCPECGYAFEWAELLDAERQRHPYLFEHHPRHNVRSFFKTLSGGLRPGRFWRTLHPSHPANLRRLTLYWVLATTLTVVAVVADFARHAYDLNETFAGQRVMLARVLADPRNAAQAQAAAARYGSVQAAIDQAYPRPTAPTFWRMAGRSFVEGLKGWRTMRVGLRIAPRYTIAVIAAVLYAAWPWLTLVALQVFQASMRRARVRPVHVLRAVVYACDAAWFLVAVAVVAGALVADPQHRFTWGLPSSGQSVAVAALVFATFTTWRLAAAYRHYLRFDHPLATVVASQVIVVLLVMVLAAYAG